MNNTLKVAEVSTSMRNVIAMPNTASARANDHLLRKGKWAEEEIGCAIHHDDSGPVFLEDMEDRFEKMRAAGVIPSEQISHQRFWADAKKVVKIHEDKERAVACDECSL